MIIYNSRNLLCKTPFGAVKNDELVTFKIYLAKTIPQNYVSLKIFPIDKEEETEIIEMKLEHRDLLYNTFTATFSSNKTGMFLYYFETKSDDVVLVLKKDENNRADFNGKDYWFLTVYDKDMERPKSFGDGVIYQIFPDRFNRSDKLNIDTLDKNIIHDRILREDWGGMPSWRPDENGKILNNDYFGGNFQGIIEKLSYISSLGVTCIYLNPIFEAHSNHRYDTADYKKIDPFLGNEEDFKILCEQAKTHGIAIVLDGVFNHTGSDSLYFNKKKRYGSGGAYNDVNSQYFSWYEFTKYPDQYSSWWGIDTLPSLNEENENLTNYICGENGVIEKWLKLGASGFRLDVVDEIPDILLDKIYETVKKVNPDAIVIGEVWEDASLKESYGNRRRYLLGGQMDSVMNYPFSKTILSYIRYGNSYNLYDDIIQIMENYPKPVISSMMNMISTHDTKRAITALVGNKFGTDDRKSHKENHFLPLERYALGKKLLMLASIIQFGLPGVPCVYYGDEAGLSGYRDPFNRVCYPWGHEDFELIDGIKKLGNIRKNNPFLVDAAFIPIIFQENYCVFARETENNKIYFVVNRSGENVVLPKFILETKKILYISGDGDKTYLSPYTGAIFQ